MYGRAEAPAAGTVVNALATGTGSAFAIEKFVRSSVELSPDEPDVRGEIANNPDADTSLIERCVELVTTEFGRGEGGTVRTEGDIPLAAGLKSSSAAANATVLATLDALEVAVGTGPDAALDRVTAALIGVKAAREVGVTVTGAYDDASASMLGGVTITDNDTDELRSHEPLDRSVLVWTPPERAYSADADVDRCKRIAPLAEVATELAMDGEYGRAMNVNGLAFCSALEFPTEPLLEALPEAEGVSLSGTGSSYVAIGDRNQLHEIRERWAARDGTTWLTKTQNEGAKRV